MKLRNVFRNLRLQGNIGIVRASRRALKKVWFSPWRARLMVHRFSENILMLRQGKFTQYAVAVVSRLAEVHEESGAWLSAAEIARSRNLRGSVTAKVLSMLAQARIVIGIQGPGGGYRLARPPSQISLWNVVSLFETVQPPLCPFGPGWCGSGTPCPLHDSLQGLQIRVETFLKKTTFSVFVHKSPLPRRSDCVEARRGKSARKDRR